MKGRSHQQQHHQPPPLPPQQQRPPPGDPLPYPDDWVDGSWTVDCSCGVTFDDGEEMVSCDECGVWVHTRCARYVRGDLSFACHNCKTAKRIRSSTSLRPRFSSPRPDCAAADSKAVEEEETEVAQLLAELPTKTDPCPPRSPSPAPILPPIWSHIPMEDRVHVQGVPGGNPDLFQGVSSVFSSQLWRCTGYIPKKLNFQYREFPCWDDEARDDKKEKEGSDNPASRGADLLFSLSKETFPALPMHQHDAFQIQRSSKKDSGASRSLNHCKDNKNRLQVLKMQPLAKKRREDSKEGKDRRSSSKKKVRKSSDDTADGSRVRGSDELLNGLSSIELYKDMNLQAKDATIERLSSEDQIRRRETIKESNCTTLPETRGNSLEAEKFAFNKGHSRGSSETVIRDNSKVETVMDQMDAEVHQISSLVDESSRGEGRGLLKIEEKYEVSHRAANGLKQPKDEKNFDARQTAGSSSIAVSPENTKGATVVPASCFRKTHGTVSLPGVKDPALSQLMVVKTEVATHQIDTKSTGNSESVNCSILVGKLHSSNLDQLEDSLGKVFDHRQDKHAIASLLSCEEKDIIRESNARISSLNETEQVGSSGPKDEKQSEREGKSTLEAATKKEPLEVKCEESFHLPTNFPSQAFRESTSVVITKEANKVLPTSSIPAISRSEVLHGSVDADARSFSAVGGQLGKESQMITYPAVKIESATCVVGNETMQRNTKDLEEGFDGSSRFRAESSQPTKTNPSISKPIVSDAAEASSLLSFKAATIENAATNLSSGDATMLSQSQVTPVKMKTASSNLCQKNEKMNQHFSQPTSKSSPSSMLLHMSAMVNSTTLSDEELALLLHQELNSSTRVPRVPRVRQAVSMQLAAASASVLSKRTSTASAKDQASAFRRKNKDDGPRDRLPDSPELHDDSRRKKKMPSPPVRQQQESPLITDRYAKKYSHNKYADTLGLARKNSSTSSTESANSAMFSLEVHGDGEKRALPVHISFKDPGKDDGSLTPCTLPGLIDDIMSKDSHITYEKLCDAVRLHWHDLRKPNGERYAYPSHVHAVHDCLRNRSQWAHLIDQAPKMNSSKKRRNADYDTWKDESEHKKAKNNNIAEKEAVETNVDSHREDFPKGKRKARKRRSLELRWKDGKESGKPQNLEAISEEEPAAISYSSHEGNENLFSEEEIQGAEPHRTGTDPSGSSLDDTD